MKRRHNVASGCWRAAGFSLIEVLISFVVLAVGLLALLSFHGTSQKNIADAKIQAEAVALAEGKLQELESFLTDTDDRLSIDTTTESVTGGLADYTLTWTVDDHADPDLTSIRVAQVDVSWTDRDGIAQQVSLVSDIHFINPVAGIEEFLKLAVAVKEPGSGGGNWVGEIPEGGGTEEPGDDEEPTDPTDPPTEPTEPEGPQVTYTVTISGSSGRNLSSIELENSPEIEEAAADPEVLASSANCSRPTNRSFTCTVTYFNPGIGWSGTITLKANGNQKMRGDSPYTTSCANTVDLQFSGVTSNITDVNLSSC